MENEVYENEGLENESISDGYVLTDDVSSSESLVESTEDLDSSNSLDFPDDYLDKQTFNDGVSDILSALEETEEEIIVDELPVVYASSADSISFSSVSFQCDGVSVYFPSTYAEDVFVKDGMLVNLGSNYTLGCVLNDYSVSNYVNSEITIPTYHSATWYQYLAQYGQPYRVVDRYINNYGSLSSSTRESVDLDFSGGNDWAGYGTVNLFLLFIVILLLIREVRTWLTS